MDRADYVNFDSDAVAFGYADILLFDFFMLGVHCSCTSCFHTPFEAPQRSGKMKI